MKTILAMMLVSFLATSVMAQPSSLATSAPEPAPEQLGKNKDSKTTSGAIIRKHDTPVTLDPAKKEKMKKTEKKKKVDQGSDVNESTD